MKKPMRYGLQPRISLILLNGFIVAHARATIQPFDDSPLSVINVRSGRVGYRKASTQVVYVSRTEIVGTRGKPHDRPDDNRTRILLQTGRSRMHQKGIARTGAGSKVKAA